VKRLGIDIDDPQYAVMGRSKGKRMRYFLQNAPRPQVIKALNALWEYREVAFNRAGKAEDVVDVHRKMAKLLEFIGGVWSHHPSVGSSTAGEAVTKATSDTVHALLTRFKALLAEANCWLCWSA
jgi:hypothetical protein